MNKEDIVNKTKNIAEGYFDRGELFCSEAVVQTINELLGCPYPKEVTKLASAFPVGMGMSGCICGAVSGGQIALGMVYGREHGETMSDEMFPVAAELHDYIKDLYKSTCCRVLVKDHEFDSPQRHEHCVEITGKVTEWVAKRLLDQEKLTLLDAKI